MLLIDTQPGQVKRKKKFYFDKRWLQREEITKVVKKAWDQEDEGSSMFKITKKIKRCRLNLLKWKNMIQINSKEKIDKMKKIIG